VVPGLAFNAVVVAIQIPEVRETVGVAQTTYHFIHSTAPSLGVAAIWLGFVLLLAGAAGTWRAHHTLAEGTAKTVAVGSAVLAMALGVLVAVEGSLNQPSRLTTPGTYTAKVPSRHSTAHHRRHRPTPKKHGNPPSTPSAPSAPAPGSIAPESTPPSAPSSESGGGPNVHVEQNIHQEVKSGNASGPNAHSGDAKAESNNPVTIG
jgi:hypothetical protein